MITRRTFLTRGAAAIAGAAVLSSGFATPALADHKNTGVPQSQTREQLKDGSGGGTPDGHPQNHGEMSQRSEGSPVLGGTQRGSYNRGRQAGNFAGDCPRGNGECDGTGPNGTGECDGMGPNGTGECDGTGPHGTGECDGTGPDD